MGRPLKIAKAQAVITLTDTNASTEVVTTSANFTTLGIIAGMPFIPATTVGGLTGGTTYWILEVINSGNNSTFTVSATELSANPTYAKVNLSATSSQTVALSVGVVDGYFNNPTGGAGYPATNANTYSVVGGNTSIYGKQVLANVAIGQNGTGTVTLSNNSNDREQIIHIRFSMSAFNYNMITDFLKMVFDDITLKGIEGIENIDISQELSINFDKETGDIKNDKEYVVYTAGINFEKIRQVKGIDLTRTRCNDIATTLRLYGIEATRQILLYELSATYSADGSAINQNHLSILIDQMCYLGEIISIDRHGLSKIEMDPIARASFERTMDHFINAAIFNEKDHLKSVSSKIAVGQVINGGTGSFDLLLDTKKLENSEYTENETGGRVTFIPLEEEPLFGDIIKNDLGKAEFYIPS